MDNYTNRQDTSPSRTARTLWQRLLTMLVLMTVIVTGAKANGWEDKDAYFKASFDNNRGCFVITIRQGDDRHGPALENGYIKDATLRYGALTLVKITGTDVEKFNFNQQAQTENITYTTRRGDDHNRCVYFDILW